MKQLLFVAALTLIAGCLHAQVTGEYGGPKWNVRLNPAGAVTMTGTGNDLLLFTYQIPGPGHSLQPGGCIDIFTVVQHTGSGSVTYKVQLGATVTTLGATAVTVKLPTKILICNRAESQTTQDAMYFVFGTAAVGTAVLTEDTSSPLTISILANAANGNSVTPQFFHAAIDR